MPPETKSPSTRVLIVGGGGREHALAWRLAQEAEVHVAPGNGGTEAIGTNHPVAADDVDGLVALAQSLQVALVVVGPEAPLALGLVDRLEALGIDAFGPKRAAAQLEASKVFSKERMIEAGVPTAKARFFDAPEDARAYVLAEDRPLVVKADGLAAGKGVVVAKNGAEAAAGIDHIAASFGDAASRLLVEELLPGREISFHVICSDHAVVPLAVAQDHKRALEGDRGPNTGGMGAYSPVPFVDAALEEAIVERCVRPVLRLMAERGEAFRGVLFVGLMVNDDASDFGVLEYNVRFGDPECEVLMARWGGPLLPVLRDAARGELKGSTPRWDAAAAATVVLTSKGYPGAYEKGKPISGAEGQGDAHVFHAGTRREGEALVTSGGRVLAVTATGGTVDEACTRAYGRAEWIEFEGKTLRKDIAWQARESRSSGP